MSAEAVIFDPSDEGPVDPSKLERSADGRPRIRVDCPNASQHLGFPEDADYLPGRVASEKRPGKTVQCPGCKGLGYKAVLYTRCTSFVSVLDDRSSLEKWKLRVLLAGLTVAPWLLDEVKLVAPTDTKGLDTLADRAFEAGDGYEKARKGTDLHKLSELVDAGAVLPAELWNEDAQAFRPVTLQDRADMAAWVRTTTELGIVWVDRELFVVEDEHRIGGTFDGLATFGKRHSNGHPCYICERPVIVDLKTGRTDYGVGKMAQQLAVYAHSRRYDPATGERTDLGACPHVGIIIALPQGTGDASVIYLDLERGWEAVQLSATVREHRREVSRGAFVIGGAA